ncbi:MAG: EutN/CcmL family microcompartment protein [Spirochaetaceae bacterium]|jgi:microcompartment protein CcmK/EutM|nr:EutN/CcmL family microcompartment protein [Spirochaetaceae bacterium]
MMIGKVMGNVVCTVKNEHYDKEKILIVQPIDSDGNKSGKTLLAVDGVQAGPGDTVLVFDEGGSARIISRNPDAISMRTVIGAIIDKVSVGE